MGGAASDHVPVAGQSEAGGDNNQGRPVATAPIVKRIELDPRKVAELFCEQHASALDFVIQDDSQVDRVRLILTKP